MLVDTGRQLEHYDTGTMTRRSRGLNYLRPAGEIEINPEDARRNGLKTGDWARLTSRRGAIEARVLVTGSMLGRHGILPVPLFSEQSANRWSAPSSKSLTHTGI